MNVALRFEIIRLDWLKYECAMAAPLFHCAFYNKDNPLVCVVEAGGPAR